MTKFQLDIAAKTLRQRGSPCQIDEAAGSVTTRPQYAEHGDQTPQPVTFVALGELSRWLKTHPTMAVPVLRG